ncbi:hypothetical protein [Nocardia sp. NPDC057272]|uniref:hypothetical protein n=1 Tax=Nocardia sp. NPDC057272 TaxID=3346079 RepID=UPI0036434A42
MARPDPRRPRDGQDALFDGEALPASVPGKITRGRISEAVDRAFASATEADLLRPEHEALQAFVRHAAWSADSFEQQNKPYGASKLIPAVTEALRELRLTPDSQADATDDDLRVLLEEIGKPSTDVPTDA